MQTCQFAAVSASIEVMNVCIPALPTSFWPIGFAPNLHALDSTVVSSLGSTHIVEAGTTAWSAALSAEVTKHEEKMIKSAMSLDWYVLWKYAEHLVQWDS